MSVSYNAMALYIFGVVGGIATYGLTDSFVLAVVVALMAGFGGLLVYVYSPAPSTNGGMLAPPARKQKWGFTTEPAAEYEEPQPEDYMSAKLAGVNWAEKDSDGE